MPNDPAAAAGRVLQCHKSRPMLWLYSGEAAVFSGRSFVCNPIPQAEEYTCWSNTGF